MRPITFARAAVAGTILAWGCAPKDKETDEEKDGHRQPVPVQAAPARTASFEKRLKAIGSVRAVPGKLVQVSAAVEGIVAGIVAAEGERVKAGQPIVRLDDRLARLDLEEKKAARAEAEAALAALRAAPREPDRRAAELEIAKEKVAVAVARSALDHLRPLQEKKEVSVPQVFEAERKLEEAEVALKAAEAKRDILMQGPRPEAVAEGEAKVARAKAAEAAAEARLGYMVLASPIDGDVAKVLCRPGQMLAGGGAAAEVLDGSEVLVVAGLPPADAMLVKAGQDARAIVEAGGGEKPAGPPAGEKVAYVGAEASASTGLVPVAVRSTASGLRPGMAARIEVVVARSDAALAVPDSAVVPAEGGPSIAVVRDGKAAVLHVKVGLRDEALGLTQVEAEGLRPGDPVITSGAYNLPDGQPVTVSAPGEKSGEKAEKDEKAEKAGEKGGGKRDEQAAGPRHEEAKAAGEKPVKGPEAGEAKKS